MKLFKRWQKSAGKAAEHGNTESKIDSADAPTADLENNDTESASKLDMSPMDVVESDAEAAVSSEFVLPTPAPEMPSEPVRESENAAPEIGFYARLKRGLSRTGNQLSSGLGTLFLGKKVIDDELLEELESQLLMADMGLEATQRVVTDITGRVSRKELADGEALMQATKAALLDIIRPCEQSLEPMGVAPFVILVVGVNGAGKTTTIGKLAHRLKAEGKSVMLAAGDTFRAAAVEQLQAWGERNEVPVIAQHTGADSASVLFDGLQAAKARGIDVLIADTAGRLQNKAHLMDELEKVVRVMRKLDPTAPHETLLVLDAGTGQNAVSQAEQFDKSVGVSGIVLTKLDGTAKGGVIFAIAQKLARPIRFVGVGEGVEDLRPFEAKPFIDALFDQREASER
jgi:fused signal recognition particle receptor